MAPNEPQKAVFANSQKDLEKVTAAWKSIQAKDLVEFNVLLAKHKLKPLEVPR